MNFTRTDLLVGLEGAQTAEILGGREDADGDGRPDANGLAVDTINVVSALTSTIDVNRNTLTIVDGARVLDHEDNLYQGSFPSLRVDGLFGVQSVVATGGNTTFQTQDALGITRTVTGEPAVFAAGTAEDKIAMFVRTQDPVDPSRSFLRYVGYVDVPPVQVGQPFHPHTMTLDPGEKFLYVLGDTAIRQFAIGSTFSGLPELTLVATYQTDLRNIDGQGTDVARGLNDLASATGSDALYRPTDIAISADGTKVFIADQGTGSGIDDTDGVLVFTRNTTTGLLTRFEQKITRLTDLGSSLDVGFDFSSGATIGSATSGLEAGGNLVVLDQPLANSAQAGLVLNSDRVTYRFNAVATSVGQTITPYVLKATTELDLNGDVVPSFQIVATGTTRIIERTGINAFSFDGSTDQTSNVFGGAEGLYFGWRTSGGAVVGSQGGTAADAFVANATGSGVSFADGVRFAMEARFEVDSPSQVQPGQVQDGQVQGLLDPTAIAAANNLSRLYVGDSAGTVATFQFDGSTGKYGVVNADVLSEAALNGAGGNSVSLRATGLGGPVQAESVSDGNVTYAGDTRIEARGGILFINNAAITLPDTVPATFSTPLGNIVIPVHLKGNEVVSVATNGSQIFVGVAQADNEDYNTNRVVKNSDNGVLLIYNLSGGTINPDAPAQVLGSITDQANFGMNLAVDGDVMVVTGSQSGLFPFGKIYERNASNQWVEAMSIPNLGVALMKLDVDGDHVIAGGISGTRIYSRQGGSWTQVAAFSEPAFDVTFDGDVARVMAPGVIHSYREINPGNWQREQSVQTAVELTTFDSLDESDNVTYSIKITKGNIYTGNDAGASSEVGFIAFDTTGYFGNVQSVYREGVDEDNYSDYAIDKTFNFGALGGTVVSSFYEDDSTSGNENSDVITISTSDGIGDGKDRPFGGEVRGTLYYDVILVDPGEHTTVYADFADSLGGLSSMVSSNGIRFITDKTVQTAMHVGSALSVSSAVSSLALKSDAGGGPAVLYVADGGASKVYALNNVLATLKGLGEAEASNPASDSVNDPPVAANDVFSGVAGTNLLIPVLNNDRDPDSPQSGFDLQSIDVVTATNLPGLVNPASLFTKNNGKEIAFTPGTALQFLGAGETATFHVYYTMADGAGSPASARLDFTVTGANDLPQGVNDTGTATENESVTFDVLANDTDTDRLDVPSTLSLSALQSVTYNQNGTSVALTGAQASALFSISGSRLAFTPGNALDALNASQSVTFTVTYQVKDSYGDSDTADFVMTVNGQNEVTPTITGETRSLETYNVFTAGNPTANPVVPDSHNPGSGFSNVNLLTGDPAGSTYTQLSLKLDGSTIGSLTGLSISAAGVLNFTPTDAAFTTLSAGQTRTVTLSYKATVPDVAGTTSGSEAAVETRTVTIKVHGSVVAQTNTVSRPLQVAIHQTASDYTRNLVAGDPAGTTVDVDTLSLVASGGTSLSGSMLVTAAGSLTFYPDAPAFSDMDAGE
ncbi:MAG: hypothetical protein WBE58_14270, partial [Verrucomicrobiales bacterium]